MDYSANPDANGNSTGGRMAFAQGKRDREEVLRAHLEWDRGIAADYHFCAGYRAAAKEAGLGDPEINAALQLIEDRRWGRLSADDRACYERVRDGILCWNS